MQAKTYTLEIKNDCQGNRYATLAYGDEKKNGHTYTRIFRDTLELSVFVNDLEFDGFTKIN